MASTHNSDAATGSPSLSLNGAEAAGTAEKGAEAAGARGAQT
jgi:hypothetical protein